QGAARYTDRPAAQRGILSCIGWKMDIKQKITSYSLQHYKRITIIMVVFTLVLGALIPLIKVDTDPENMLSEDEPVRVFHNQTKTQFSLSDIVV
ncbi:MAG: hypothetical protein ACYTGS_09380, partial [Planctomycetota bacterium]